MSLTLIPARVAQLDREVWRERSSEVGSSQARSRKATKREVRRLADIPRGEVEDLSREAVEAVGYRELSPVEVAQIVEAVERVAVGYPGLDDSHIVSLALGRVARGLVYHPIVESVENPREGQLMARAFLAAHRVARTLKTGRGSMPRVYLGERSPGSPNYATWIGLGPSYAIDSRCWCSRGEACQDHKREARRVVEAREVEAGTTRERSSVERSRVYAREVEAAIPIGKAGKGMRWLANGYRDPERVLLVESSEAVNDSRHHAAILSALGEVEAVSREGLYVRSRLDKAAARRAYVEATGEAVSWHGYAAILKRALLAASEYSPGSRSIETAYREASRVEVEARRGEAREVEAVEARRVARVDTLRIEIGPRAWHYSRPVERSRREVEASRVEARAARWVEVEAVLVARVEGRGETQLPAPLVEAVEYSPIGSGRVDPHTLAGMATD